MFRKEKFPKKNNNNNGDTILDSLFSEKENGRVCVEH
jgi:hypothetical protein